MQWNQHGWRDLGQPDEPMTERPSLVQNVVAQLAAAGHSPKTAASALRFGERLFEEAVWPNGRDA